MNFNQPQERNKREKSVVAISVDFELYKTRNIDQMNLDQNRREKWNIWKSEIHPAKVIFN